MKRVLLILSVILLTATLQPQEIGRYSMNKKAAAAAPAGNMISNGTFDSGTDWSVTGNCAIGSGVMTYTDGAPGTLAQAYTAMNSVVQPLTNYRLTFTVSGTSGGGLYFTIGNGEARAYVGISEYNNGDKTIDFTSPEDPQNGGISFSFNPDGDSGGSIDNIVLIAL